MKFCVSRCTIKTFRFFCFNVRGWKFYALLVDSYPVSYAKKKKKKKIGRKHVSSLLSDNR